MKVTLSVIKADIGGYVGHPIHIRTSWREPEQYGEGQIQGMLIDYHVTKCGMTCN